MNQGWVRSEDKPYEVTPKPESGIGKGEGKCERETRFQGIHLWFLHVNSLSRGCDPGTRLMNFGFEVKTNLVESQYEQEPSQQ